MLLFSGQRETLDVDWSLNPTIDVLLPRRQAIGSDPLESQIRRLGSDVHVYGHTHIPFDIGVEGVRYVQWPLGECACASRLHGAAFVMSDDVIPFGSHADPPGLWALSCMVCFSWSQDAG